MSGPLATLGLEPGADAAAIRKAYAGLIRQFRPDTHPQEFSRIREAYEQALAAARSEQAREASAHAPSAQPVAAPRPSDPADEPPAPPEIGSVVVPTEPTAPMPPGPPTAEPQSLVTARALIAQLAQCFNQSGDVAAAALLHQQHEQVGREAIDVRLDWELVFLHSLLSDASPPPLLLFEGDRLLGWSRRRQDVIAMFGEGGAQRLDLLLELANEHVFACGFSLNRWHARLFNPGTGSWFGFTPHVKDAVGLARFWRQRSEAVGLEGMAQRLNPAVLGRFDGPMILSVDAIWAIVVAWLGWLLLTADSSGTSWIALMSALAAVCVAGVVPAAARALSRRSWPQHVLGWHRAIGKLPAIAIGVSFAIWFFASIAMANAVDSPLVRVVGITLLWSGGLWLLTLVLVGIWYVSRMLEALVTWPVIWLQRFWAMKSYETVRAQHEQSWTLPARFERLKIFPGEVLSHWRTVRRTRAEEKRQAKVNGQASSGSGFNPWWLLWALVVIFQFYKAFTK